MKRPLLLTLAALAAFSLAGCTPGTGHLDTYIREHCKLPDAVEEEALALLQHYLRTGDALYATPQHHITMLHLAAMTQRLALVKHLLDEGADPNALMLPPAEGEKHETPLSFSMSAYRIDGQPEAGDTLLIVDELMQAGAKLNPTAAPCTNVLSACAGRQGNGQRVDFTWEDLALRLMEMGAKGGLTEAEAFTEAGWRRALARLLPGLPEAELAKLRQQKELWELCAAPFDHSPYRHYPGKEREAAALACTTALLRGAAAPMPKAAQTAFNKVAKGLLQTSEAAGDFPREGLADFLALMLQHGVDVSSPLSPYGKACAADYLAADAAVAARLREKALLPEPPAHHLNADVLIAQLLDIPTAAIRSEEAAQAFELLAQLIAAPTEEQLAAPLLQRQACAKALTLLARTDRARTQQLLRELPAWSSPEAWEGRAVLTARGMLYALQQQGEAILPAAFLQEAALRMEAAGRPELAHAFIRLLEKDGSAEALTLEAEYEKPDAPAALRAAALTNKLHRMGLPALDDIRRRLPLRKLGYEEPVDIALTAGGSARGLAHDAALQQPERLFYTGSGNSSKPPSDSVAEALHTLGAPLAEAWYSKGEGDAAAASLELEIALAEHILRHKAEFLHPQTGLRKLK